MSVRAWGNPVLHVDLGTGRVEKIRPGQDTREKFLLGRGLGDWLLLKHVKPGTTDPLGPGNVLAFGSGILVGTGFPGAVRTSIVSLNVLTGGYGESSCGGFFATRLKKAGLDGLLVSGSSELFQGVFGVAHVEAGPETSELPVPAELQAHVASIGIPRSRRFGDSSEKGGGR